MHPVGPQLHPQDPGRRTEWGQLFGLGGNDPQVCTMSTTGMGAGTARVKLFMAVGLGRRIPVRVQAHPPDQHSLTWSYGDSCTVRALGGGSAVPPPPGQPRSVLHGVPGVSAPSLLSWLPVPLTSKSTARRQGPAHPHGHAQGHLAPYPPCSPSSTPAWPSEPSHSS